MKNYCHLEGGVEVVPNAWSSELLADLIGLIAEKMRSLSLCEYIRFGSVCLEWRCFSIENYQPIKLSNKLPVLLIPLSSPLHHHQKNISSSPSEEEDEEDSSSQSEEEEEEGEGEEEHTAAAEEEKEAEEEEEPEELCDEEDGEEEEEEEGAEEHKATADADTDEFSDEYSDSEEDSDKVVAVRVKPGRYYNPNDIWQGQDAKQRYKSVRNFYSLSEKTVYHDFPLPVPYYKNIRGSSHGWLVTVEECHDENGQLYLPVCLFNPFRPTDNNEIQLPPMTHGNPGNLDLGERIYRSYFLQRALLSANPSSLSDPTTQLVVLATYGQYRLAFCRPGDKSWTRLDLGDDYRPIFDIVCYDDQFYAVLQNGVVFAFVFDASQPFPTPIVTKRISPPRDYGLGYISSLRYLVQSEGDLLHVRRIIRKEVNGLQITGYKTLRFLVSKLDPTGEWAVEMKTLNNHMIFIGNSSSMSIPASYFPRWSRPNSIYYTDDNYEYYSYYPQIGPHDIGIFNLEDGSFERHYEAESNTINPVPVWIQPML